MLGAAILLVVTRLDPSDAASTPLPCVQVQRTLIWKLHLDVTYNMRQVGYGLNILTAGNWQSDTDIFHSIPSKNPSNIPARPPTWDWSGLSDGSGVFNSVTQHADGTNDIHTVSGKFYVDPIVGRNSDALIEMPKQSCVFKISSRAIIADIDDPDAPASPFPWWGDFQIESLPIAPQTQKLAGTHTIPFPDSLNDVELPSLFSGVVWEGYTTTGSMNVTWTATQELICEPALQINGHDLTDRYGPVNARKIVKPNGEVLAYVYRSGMSIDLDGAPNAYAPDGKGLHPLDKLTNAYSVKDGKKQWYGVYTDKNGNPVTQPSGYYVTSTSLGYTQYSRRDQRRYIDATTVPYFVMPSPTELLPTLGFPDVGLGDLAYVYAEDKEQGAAAIYADWNRKVGEASLATALAIGHSEATPSGVTLPRGSSPRMFLYVVFPRSGTGEPLDQADIAQRVANLLPQLHGIDQVQACLEPLP